MSGLLVSIRNLAEARTACEHDIAILDIKNPDNGALGAADPQVLSQIVESKIGIGMAKSFSAGELSDWIELDPAKQKNNGDYPSKLRFSFAHVKVGLANVSGMSGWQQAWKRFFETNFKDSSAVAVAYLDFENCNAPSPKEIIELASSTEFCDTILFDTFHKNGNLFRHVSDKDLCDLVETSKSHLLRTVVAGSVDHESAARVLKSNPDLIGVRGAVCRGTRTGVVDSLLIKRMIEVVS